jgi:hypothetical protein
LDNCNQLLTLRDHRFDRHLEFFEGLFTIFLFEIEESFGLNQMNDIDY